MPTPPTYPTDTVLSEVADIVDNQTNAITLPFEPGGTDTLTVINGVIDPANLPTAPYCWIEITDGQAGNYAVLGEDDVLTVSIGVVLFCDTSSDAKYLPIICHAIQRGLEDYERFRDKMMKFAQNEIKLHWSKSHQIDYPLQAAKIELTCRAPK